MCHFLLSLETSVETMVPLQHFLLFCLCSAKHDGTNEPIKRAGGCAVPGEKWRNWDGLISSKVGLTGDSQLRWLKGEKLPYCEYMLYLATGHMCVFVFGILITADWCEGVVFKVGVSEGCTYHQLCESYKQKESTSFVLLPNILWMAFCNNITWKWATWQTISSLSVIFWRVAEEHYGTLTLFPSTLCASGTPRWVPHDCEQEWSVNTCSIDLTWPQTWNLFVDTD